MENIDDNLPQSYNEYDYQNLQTSEEINKQLFENKFTKSQAKVFYEMLNSKLENKLSDIKLTYEQENEIQKLSQHFGGQEQWLKTAEQLEEFAKTNMSEKLYDSLSSSYEGVVMLYDMMKNKEPKILDSQNSCELPLNLESLKKMMSDPKYWRDNDKSFCDKIKSGFEKLYK